MQAANDITTTTQLLPEWALQSAVMLTWPHEDTIWADMLDDIDAAFVEISAAIVPNQSLIITCYHAAHQKHIQRLLLKAGVNISKVHCYIAPSDDIWVRDHGPVTIIDKHSPCLLDFTFNGWGNKYPAEHDNQITHHLHQQHAFGHTPVKNINMVLEGGSIEVDGSGTLMTTNHCLLSPERNPNMNQDEIENTLKDLFGLKQILWLDHGYLNGDDTDGHIDTLARFVNSHTICYVQATDKNDEHYDELNKMEVRLKTFRNHEGRPYQFIPLPMPRACYAKIDGRRLPATYANFLIINHAVLVPVYNDPADDEALKIFAGCFPDRKIIPIHSLPIIQWNGSVHCMTMQLPEGILT